MVVIRRAPLRVRATEKLTSAGSSKDLTQLAAPGRSVDQVDGRALRNSNVGDVDGRNSGWAAADSVYRARIPVRAQKRLRGRSPALRTGRQVSVRPAGYDRQ